MFPILFLLKSLEMHIPDGLLSLPVSLACWGLAALFLGLAIRRTQQQLGERQLPLIGVMAAFIFAAQMINFPVIGGTSGHLLGGALAAITLGPWAAMLVIASVVIVQGLLFQDGGLLVMGANLVNMGVLAVITGYGVYRIGRGRSPRPSLVTAGIAAWLSVIAAALATSLELWLSGTARLALVAPAMLGVHALIGIGESLISVAALAFILRTRPDLIGAFEAGPSKGHGWAVAGLAITLAVVLISPLASIYPDGLERVALDLGLVQGSRTASFSPLANYQIPFLGRGSLSTVLAGMIGVGVVLVSLLLAVRLLRFLNHQGPKTKA